MTKSQRKYLDQLTANIEAAKAVGLTATVEVEDHDFFISVRVRIEFDTSNVKTRRIGHDQQFRAALMIGKRGGVDGSCQAGSIFSDNEYRKGVYGGDRKADLFSFSVRNGCEYEINDLIRTAERMAELDNEAA